MAAPLLAALPVAVTAIGTLTLPEIAACFARCSGFVGNDSGLMHLAAAAGAPTVGLFAHTDPGEYGPIGRCAVPVKSRTDRIEDISVAEVVSAFRGLVGDLGAGGVDSHHRDPEFAKAHGGSL